MTQVPEVVDHLHKIVLAFLNEWSSGFTGFLRELNKEFDGGESLREVFVQLMRYEFTFAFLLGFCESGDILLHFHEGSCLTKDHLLPQLQFKQMCNLS